MRNTTRYGLNSFTYLGAKLWNSLLSDNVKMSMPDKHLIPLVGRGEVVNTHLVSLSDIDSGHNSVTIHKVIIVVID